MGMCFKNNNFVNVLKWMTGVSVNVSFCIFNMQFLIYLFVKIRLNCHTRLPLKIIKNYFFLHIEKKTDIKNTHIRSHRNVKTLLQQSMVLTFPLLCLGFFSYLFFLYALSLHILLLIDFSFSLFLKFYFNVHIIFYIHISYY